MVNVMECKMELSRWIDSQHGLYQKRRPTAKHAKPEKYTFATNTKEDMYSRPSIYAQVYNFKSKFSCFDFMNKNTTFGSNMAVCNSIKLNDSFFSCSKFSGEKVWGVDVVLS